MGWRQLASAWLVLLAVLAAGCGGGSSTTAQPSRPGPSPTSTGQDAKSQGSSPAPAGSAVKLQFIARADAVCKRLIVQLKHSRLAKPTVAELARVTPAHVAIERRGLSDLSKLEPPATLAGEWRHILSYVRTLARELAALGSAAKAHDQGAIQALATSKKRVHEQLRKAAARNGFKECPVV